MRRKFYEAAQQVPPCGPCPPLLQNLYRTEARLRDTRAGPKLRALARVHESQPILTWLNFLLRLWKTQRRILPKSLLGQAIDYALGQWTSLLPYLADGRLDIENNLVENAIRPTAIGKKNWLFFGTEGAGERSAIVYTIIESCHRRALDPAAYLRNELTRLPMMTTSQIKEVTPAAWAKAQRTSIRAAA